MDGLKAKLNSLQFRLAVALAIMMILVAMLIGSIGYYSTLHDAHELQDDHLVDIAAMVSANRIAFEHSDEVIPHDLEDPDNHVVIQLTDSKEAITSGNQETRIQFPNTLNPGLHTIKIQDTEWRVFVQSWPTGGHLVVAQRTEVRDELAEHAGGKTLIRILAIIPFLVLLMIVILRWMLRPLSRLTSELNSRKADDVGLISISDLPTELIPFVASINELLRRISATLSQQRRFVADAAHELRSPLTALSLQTKNLLSQETSDAARRQLNDFGKGLQRASGLVDQLLSMARAQLATQEVPKTVDLSKAMRTIFEELMPSAEMKGTEMEYEQSTDFPLLLVNTSELEFVTLFRNLIDNAIRYSGTDGKILVEAQKNGNEAVVVVTDNGPGIPPEDHDRVFDPFYRVLGTEQPGSGLGLSIAKSIVTKLKGKIQLSYSDPTMRRGTVVHVSFPVGSKP